MDKYYVIENQNIGLRGCPQFIETVLFAGTLEDCVEYEDEIRKTYKDQSRVDCWTISAEEYIKNKEYSLALEIYQFGLTEEELNEVIEMNGKKYKKHILDFRKIYYEK